MTDDNDHLSPDEGDLKQKLNLETAQINWAELQRHFARGVVLVIGGELDLIEVAVKFSEDDTQQFEEWINSEQIWRAQDEEAKAWHASRADFWSVVIAPWVLVQEIKPESA